MTPKLLHEAAALADYSIQRRTVDARRFRICQRAVERYARRWRLAGDGKYPPTKRTESML